MHNVPLLTTIAAAFAFAWVFGLVTQKLRLSPIVGYLLAGIAIGPYTPGYVGDVNLASQLAEVGVILLMFGVGLHFHIKDLLAVKGIAVPGAVVQSLCATLAAVAVFHFFGWPIRTGIVVGMAMSVASTVVLLRVLMDRHMLNSAPGHAAVGWLIVEDIFTVLALVLVPMLAAIGGGVELPAAETSQAVPAVRELAPDASALEHARHAYEVAKQALQEAMALENKAHSAAAGGWQAVVWAVGKLVALVAVVLLAGSKVVPWILIQVARLRSRELFTLTVLVLSIAIAVGSAVFFGASVALGAFLAGMVVAQSPVSHQAAADALPMRDAFSVLFFVAVGMLFDPMFLVEQPLMTAAGLGIVLLVKPITALAVVAVLGYPVRTGLTVALALSQIGEFSFILSQVSREHGLMPDDGHNLLVACAIISITLNPLVFGRLDAVERWLMRRPRLWKILNARAQKRIDAVNRAARQMNAEAANKPEKPLAVIVGYGPVGRLVDALLRDSGMETCIIEMNMDTVQSLHRQGRLAIYGDAGLRDVLVEAGIERAVHLIVTLPHSSERAALVMMAKDINPDVEVTVRARYLREIEELKHAGASKSIFEEGEAGIALARHVMERRNVDRDAIEKLLGAVRKLWGIRA